MQKYKQMIYRRFVKLLLTLIFLWLAGFCYFVYSIPNGPSQNYLNTEAFIIFTGGTNRVSTGIEEFTKSKADKILISGVGINVSKADIASKLPQIKANFECNDNVVLGRIAESTFTNATETAIFVQINNLKSITVVTSGYHMPRSQLVLADKLPDTRVEYLPIKSTKNGTLINKLSLLVTEYHKSAVSLAIIISDRTHEYYWNTLKAIRDLIKGR